MNVFADYHHGGLYHSFEMLFEDRLGGKVFKPIGHEWFKQGYWNYTSNNDPMVTEQFLGMPNDTDFFKGYKLVSEGDNWVTTEELMYGRQHRCLTFEQFIKTDIDIIIASIPAHEETFAKLIRDHKPNAKLIKHEGNTGYEYAGRSAKNFMISIPGIGLKYPEGSNVIEYHQEFDLNTFNFEPPRRENRLTSMMNCMPQWSDYPTWVQYKQLLPDYEWKMHGILGEDGNLDRIDLVAKAIKDSTFIWHLKGGATVGGHILFNALACGRPLIIKGSYVYGELLGKLQDGVNCIDLEKRRPEENVAFIKECSQPEKYKLMSQNAYNLFKEISDFDSEFEKIKIFLNNLQ